MDTGISGLHLLGDAAANALIPGSGLAMTGVRSFGSGAAEARNNGVWKKSEGDRKNRTQIQGFDHLMITVYIDNEPYVADLRVRLVREAPDRKTDNVLYYFTPEEILSVKKADASSLSGKRRAFTAHGGDSASAE